MKKKPFVRWEKGGALVMALAFGLVLASAGAACFFVVGRQYRVVHQAACWQVSLLAAEAGVDFAMNEVRKTLYDPSGAFTGSWTRGAGEPFVDTNGNGSRDANEAYTDTNANGQYDAQGASYLSSAPMDRTGEGGTRSYALVTVDLPFEDAQGEPYYRIRSTGITDVTGPPTVAGEKADLVLRKLSLLRDRRTGTLLSRPQARRYVEAVAKPVYAFRLAMMAVEGINLNNHNIVIDSWDSEDPAKSLNGAYPAGMADRVQWNGDIATNGELINAGSAHVYGTAGTNGGSVTNADNVTGHRGDPENKIYSNFYQDVIEVVRPVNITYDLSVSSVSGSAVLQAGSAAPVNFLLDQLRLSGSETLKLAGVKDASGAYQESYIQIVVRGDTSLTGNAQIILDPGVRVRFFVEGNVDIAGNGFSNPNDCLHLQMYGVAPPAGTVRSMSISGNGGFKGAVYAPSYDLTIVGGGTEDTIFGAFVGKTIRMTGVQSVHYDEALGRGGLVADYQIASWYEEDR